jgi:Family of unknown function (DUF5989)
VNEEETVADFEKAAQTDRQKGAAAEFWYFLSQNKKWWLLPIVTVMVLFGVLVFLSSTGAAPFIYTLF